MHSMHHHTSTTALFDSSERVNSRLDKPYDQFDRYDRNDSSFNKYALDDENDWDGQISFYDPVLMNSLNNGKGDRDSGLVSLIAKTFGFVEPKFYICGPCLLYL